MPRPLLCGSFPPAPSRRVVDSVSSHNSAASTHLEHTNQLIDYKRVGLHHRKIDAVTLTALFETKGNARGKGVQVIKIFLQLMRPCGS